jgi:hypothetical protein
MLTQAQGVKENDVLQISPADRPGQKFRLRFCFIICGCCCRSLLFLISVFLRCARFPPADADSRLTAACIAAAREKKLQSLSLLKAVADALGVSSRQRVTIEVVPLEAAVLQHCELVLNKQFLSRADLALFRDSLTGRCV